jgi:hypothetical protein
VIDRSPMRDIPHSPVALYEAAHLFGTRIAETILARVQCANAQIGRTYGCKRSDQSAANTLQGGGRSLIAARPSRPEYCPARVTVLSAVSRAAATSGPVRKRGHCKVHNGLTRDRVPTAPTAQLPAPSPGGDTLVLNARDAISAHYAGIGCEGQRNGCPDRQTLCRRTANLRAKATRALPGPERCSMASAEVFRCSGRLTR